ncbi:MAG TPA: sodium:solute symporter family protein [Lacibacter sp.]|nr:sodium:solute symporter family protein [Lacibacter sp.]
MLVLSVFAYFLINVGIGFWAKRRVANTRDFLSTGRHLHPAVNTATFFALWFGSETLFGASSRFVNEGVQGIIEDPLGGALCLVLVGLVFARKLYRENVLTLGDIFKNRFGPLVEQVSAALMALSFFGYTGAQIVALGIVMESILEVPFVYGMIISSGIVILYTFLGGMWAVSLTDFIQGIMIVAGLMVLAYLTWQGSGGIGEVWNSVPPAHKKMIPEADLVSRVNWLAAWMVLGVGSIFSQDVFQRVNSARSEKAAVWSSILGGFFYLLLSFLPIFIVAAAAMHNDWRTLGAGESALSVIVKEQMPVGVQALFFGAVLSAVMSTCSGALLAPAGLISENLIKPHWKAMRETPRTELWVTKLTVVFCGLAGLGIALYRQDIFQLVSESSIIGLVSIAAPLTAVLFFSYKSKEGVLASMTGGLLVWFLCEYVWHTPVAALVPGLLASLLLLLVVPYLRLGKNKNKG